MRPRAEPTDAPVAGVAIWAIGSGCQGAAAGEPLADGGAGLGAARISGARLAGGAMWEVRLWLPGGILTAQQPGAWKSETQRRPWRLLQRPTAEVGRRGRPQRATNQLSGLPFADVSAGLKVTGRVGRHGGASSYAVDVRSSAPGLFAKL